MLAGSFHNSNHDTKLVIAKSITRAVLAVHSADLVHKNAWPDAIIAFSSTKDQDTTANLVGLSGPVL